MAALNGNQEEAAVLLARGDKVASVARALKIRDATVRSWLKKPDFVAAIQRAREEIRDSVLVRFAAQSEEVLDRLYSIIMDPETGPGVAATAAVQWLRLSGFDGKYQREESSALQEIGAMFAKKLERPGRGNFNVIDGGRQC